MYIHIFHCSYRLYCLNCQDDFPQYRRNQSPLIHPDPLFNLYLTRKASYDEILTCDDER